MTANTLSHRTIRHDGVTLPMTRGGRGRPLVLCPGLNSTQAELRVLVDLLRRDHDVITFDLRGHGTASPADDYTFDAFLGDLAAVLDSLDLSEPPVLMGYSLGADLAVHYAAGHPGAVAGLVLIDGANPVPEPFVTDTDLPQFRAMWEDLALRNRTAVGTPRQVLLTAREILDLNLELDVLRSGIDRERGTTGPGILDRYREIQGPITMIMSTWMAGNSAAGRAPRHNRLWRAGIDRLLHVRPDIAVSWLDADHRLVFTHAPDIARIVRGTLVDR
ncbi:alpha/beta fold hydrolase [Nocardia blacklockiae]|uniref:alpha/beta fold hydrolase n=1 Tax=Nocardia blacklockiae TaxID=480036 RepID=UPI001E659FB8|nr:alpha/beta fold hydrolase [Nocardia blacklockiae]